MSEVNFVQTIDTAKLNELEKEIQTYLYERKHSIDQHLVIDLAIWAYGYGNRMYVDGQFTNEKITITTTKAKK